MIDYTWIDINSTGLRKAIVMIAELFHEGFEPTNEEVGEILHKTTQRSGLKNAPIMLESVKEISKQYEIGLRKFCAFSRAKGIELPAYTYQADMNCAEFGETGLCIGVSNSIPTDKDFESLSNCKQNEIFTILNLCDGKIYNKPGILAGEGRNLC